MKNTSPHNSQNKTQNTSLPFSGGENNKIEAYLSELIELARAEENISGAINVQKYSSAIATISKTIWDNDTQIKERCAEVAPEAADTKKYKEDFDEDDDDELLRTLCDLFDRYDDAGQEKGDTERSADTDAQTS